MMPRLIVVAGCPLAAAAAFGALGLPHISFALIVGAVVGVLWIVLKEKWSGDP